MCQSIAFESQLFWVFVAGACFASLVANEMWLLGMKAKVFLLGRLLPCVAISLLGWVLIPIILARC
jgi:hypothetical protein